MHDRIQELKLTASILLHHKLSNNTAFCYEANIITSLQPIFSVYVYKIIVNEKPEIGSLQPAFQYLCISVFSFFVPKISMAIVFGTEADYSVSAFVLSETRWRSREANLTRYGVGPTRWEECPTLPRESELARTKGLPSSKKKTVLYRPLHP
jgi:hypothetical protein